MKKSPNPYTFIQVKRLSHDPIHRMNFYSSGITHKREKHPHFSFKLQKYKKIEYCKRIFTYRNRKFKITP